MEVTGRSRLPGNDSAGGTELPWQWCVMPA